MMFSRFHHACVIVSNMEKSLTFYRDLLGLEELLNIKIDADPVMMGMEDTLPKQHLVMLSAGNAIIELIQYIEPIGKPYDRRTCDYANMHICFEVDDINKTYQDALAKGIKSFHKKPDLIGEAGGDLNGYWYVYFRGPDSEILEFIQVPSK
jgi:catechol 2,3-dioxygenase-like lactoylglutathione lyase family enzyme